MINRYFTLAFVSIDKFLNSGQERSIRAKKNILTSVFIKGGSIGVSLLLVPLTINYVSPSHYGIWLTLSSVVAWFSFFDIGLTQGLRNKFAESKANNDPETAQKYVSTAYGILGIIFLSLLLLFLVINPFLNWSSMLNLNPDLQNEVAKLAIIVFTYFCLQFILKIITTIFIADQQPAKASLIDFAGQLLSLLCVVILVKTTEGSLINLGLALCIPPIVALLGANFFFFNGKYKAYRPKFSKIRLNYARSLFSLGLVFFVIQGAAIIQFETANIIISRNFGPEDVTSFNIVYKYFGILNMGFVIFLSPFWSASTEAFLRNDIDWIRNSMRKYNLLNILFITAGAVMLIFSGYMYDLWLGKDVVIISFKMSLWGFIYFSILIYESKYVSFLNGISALKLQFWTSMFSPFLFIGLVYLFINYYNMGVYSLFLASIIANFNGFIVAPLQYHMIVVRNKKGIWIK